MKIFWAIRKLENGAPLLFWRLVKCCDRDDIIQIIAIMDTDSLRKSR